MYIPAKYLVEKAEEHTPLGKHIHGQEKNVKINLQVMRLGAEYFVAEKINLFGFREYDYKI
jgi:hypothetical protein